MLLLSLVSMFLTGCGELEVSGRVGKKEKAHWTYMLVKKKVVVPESKGETLNFRDLVQAHIAGYTKLGQKYSISQEEKTEASARKIRLIISDKQNVGGQATPNDYGLFRIQNVPKGSYVLIAVPVSKTLKVCEFCRTVEVEGRTKVDLGSVASR